MEEETGSGSRTKGQTEKGEEEGRIKMGTGSGTHGERKSRTENRGE